MSWVSSDYIKLLLLRPDEGPDRWLIALRPTADYYGWTKHFEEWSPKPVGTSGGYTLCADPGRRGKMYCEGGRRHRISRSPSKAGHPAGLCNAFKLSRSCTLADIGELAYLTNEGWYWMTGPTGERISRTRWLDIHKAGTRKEGRGLVSV